MQERRQGRCISVPSEVAVLLGVNVRGACQAAVPARAQDTWKGGAGCCYRQLLQTSAAPTVQPGQAVHEQEAWDTGLLNARASQASPFRSHSWTL